MTAPALPQQLRAPVAAADFNALQVFGTRTYVPSSVTSRSRDADGSGTGED